MQRKDDKLLAELVARRLYRAGDFVSAWHEYEHVAFGIFAHQPLRLAHRDFPTGRSPGGCFNIHIDRKGASLDATGCTDADTLPPRRHPSRRHDDDQQIGPSCFLDLQRARQGMSPYRWRS